MAACLLHSKLACLPQALRRNRHTVRARQASDCHIQRNAPEDAQHTTLQLSENALARCSQGSELMVSSNAIFGAVCRAVRCCAVRCSEVHSACWLAVLHRICKLVCMQAFSRAWLSGERPRLKESGRGGCCSVEEAIGSSPGALSRLTALPAVRKRLEFINRTLVRDLGIHSLPQKYTRPRKKPTLLGPPFLSVLYSHFYSMKRLIDPAEIFPVR